MGLEDILKKREIMYDDEMLEVNSWETQLEIYWKGTPIEDLARSGKSEEGRYTLGKETDEISKVKCGVKIKRAETLKLVQLPSESKWVNNVREELQTPDSLGKDEIVQETHVTNALNEETLIEYPELNENAPETSIFINTVADLRET